MLAEESKSATGITFIWITDGTTWESAIRSLEEMFNELEKGIILDGMKTKKSSVKVKKIDKKNNKSYVEITITEGRNHQVKNMFGYFNHKVLKLKRIKYAFFDLSNLKIGEYRKLTIKEVKQLYNYVK